jgi:hypothetical protein
MALKKNRVWLILISIPVILAIAVVVFLKIYFSSDRLKSFVIPKVETAINKKVEVKDISLSLFPTFGVEIEGLKITNPETGQFKKPDYVSLDELLLKVKIFPLFKNMLEVDEIILRRPYIYLEVTKDGLANYSVPQDTTQVEPETPVNVKIETGSGATLLLSNFQIIDGYFEYINQKENTHIAVSTINQKTRIETSPATQDVFIKSEWKVGGISYGSTESYLIENMPLNINQTLTYMSKEDELVFDSVLIGIKDVALQMTGSVKQTQTTPLFDLKLESKSTELAQLLSLVPKEFLKAAEGFSASGKFNFAMLIRGEAKDTILPDMSGKFSLVNGSVRYSQLPKAITDINVDGFFKKNNKTEHISIEKLSLNVANNKIEGRLGINNFDDPIIDAYFNGSLNLSQIKDFYPLEKGTELAGILASNVSLSGNVKVPTSIKSNGKIEFQNVSIATSTSPKPIRNLNGVINFNNQIIESKQLAMNIGESDLKMAFTVKNYIAMVMEQAEKSLKPSATITLTSNRLRTSDLVADNSKVGKGNGEKLKPAAPMILPNVDVDANVNIEKFSTDKFDFDNARGSLRFSDGIVNLKKFSVNAFQGSILTDGTLDLRKPEERLFNLNLDIVGVEANSFLPKFTSFGNNLFGKFTMNTSLKGSLDDTLGIISKTLLGDGKVQVYDGRLTGYPIMAKVSDFTGVNELREVEFKNWSNTFTISNGRINIKDLKINSLNTDFAVNGSQGFDGTLDYNMTIKLPGSASERLKIGGLGGQVMNLLKDKEGRINLNLLVGGILNKPSVALDTKEQQKQLEELARQEMDKRKGEIESKAREEVKKLLQDSLKQKGVEDLKKKAEDQLKKLFKK